MSFLLWNVITLAAVLVSIGGMLVFRKFTDREKMKENNPVTDPLMATIGMLFAILLGFMVANAMTKYEECRLTVLAEAAAVGDIFRLARGLHSADSRPIMIDCLDYIDTVVEMEWPQMAEMETNDRAWSIYTDMWKQISRVEPKTQGQSNIHQVLVQSITKLGECRRARSAQLQSKMPAVLWLVVISGAVITVVFSFFFGLDSVILQTVMTAMLTYVLCMNMYLLVSFNTPFVGDIKLKPTAFSVNRPIFRQILKDDLNSDQNVK
ncbi:MAG: DUF4239 domain-containing protein [Cyanobacteria bacterium SZAS TMP-1]|nr:DUF4239 domain-containing protein [Cyanobacteria bacterium SZAS TMP-1]